MIGTTISHYRVLEKLGQGGMGVVFKAKDEKLDRFVALKFLPSAGSGEDEYRERLIREAQAASSLDHTNIGTVHEINETPEGLCYVVMAYYDGETLRQRLDRGPLPLDEVLNVADQIAHGMANAHAHGIIHRDLKPGNVMFTTAGTAQIIDFGLVKMTGRSQLTKSNTSVGTVAYMAPEQGRGEEVGPTADIWSLGVILYEMLAGRLPFRGEFEAAMLYSIGNEDPEPLAKVCPGVPAPLAELIGHMLEKDATRRIQSMREVSAALESIIHLRDAGIELESSKLLRQVAVGFIRNHRLSLALGGSVLLALIGFLLFRAGSPETSVDAGNRSRVLRPFFNLGDSSTAYLPEGIGEEMAQILGRIPGMMVIPGKKGSGRAAATPDSLLSAEYGVRYALWGSVRAAPARVSFEVFLADLDRHETVFSRSYGSARAAFPTMRRQVLRDIIDALGLNGDAALASLRDPTMEVYESYLRGLQLADLKTGDDSRMAREYFLDAIGKDSLFLPPMLRVALIDVDRYRQGWEKSEAMLRQARGYCLRVLRADSLNSTAWGIIGMIEDLRGDHAGSLRHLQRSLDLNPNNEMSLSAISFIYLTELNEPAKGVIYLKRVAEFHPTDWLVAQNLGVGYAQLKKYPEAKGAFFRAMRLNPEHEWPVYSLAYACQRLGEFDSAVFYYRNALQKNPALVNAYENLSALLMSAGKHAAAETLLAGGLSRLPGNYQLLYAIGVAREYAGKGSAAIQTFRSGLSIVEHRIGEDSTSADLHAYAGLFHARLRNLASCVAEAGIAARLDSTDEETVMMISKIYAALGDKDQMLAWYRRAKKMNPEYDVAYLTHEYDFLPYREDRDLLSTAAL